MVLLTSRMVRQMMHRMLLMVILIRNKLARMKAGLGIHVGQVVVGGDVAEVNAVDPVAAVLPP